MEASGTNRSAARRQRQRSELREKILQAARQLFAEHEFSEVSLRRIADAIDYSATTIYLHFKDKNELVLELIAEGFEALKQRMLEGYHPDPLVTLRQSALFYLGFGVEQPHLYRLMFQLRDPELNRLTREHRDRITGGCFEYLLETIGRLRQQGQLVEGHSDMLLAHYFWASLHGACSLWISSMLDRMQAGEQERFFAATVERLSLSLLKGEDDTGERKPPL